MKKITFLFIFLCTILFSGCVNNTTTPTSTTSPSTTVNVPSQPTLPATTVPSTTIKTTVPSSTAIESTIKKEINVLDINGYNELITLSIEDNLEEYKIYYSLDNGYYKVANDLVFNEDGIIRCEIPGLKAGNYSLKIEAKSGSEIITKEINNISVSALDRSGYAHYNNKEGIGAYKDDGTLKDNTTILYLTNENKNTITAKFGSNTYIGIARILGNISKSENPVVIRVIGRISTNQWNYKAVIPRLTDDSNLDSTHFENTFSNEYGENIENLSLKLIDKRDGKVYRYNTTKNGIVPSSTTTGSKGTVKYSGSVYPDIKGKEVYWDDSSYNCLYINKAKNLTIEGISDDAEIFQWGFSFSNCKSIEIRNLTFTDYPEDAIGFSSDAEAISEYGYYWIHNNKFNPGKNNWDLTGEQDKHSGDGSIDLNNVSNATTSYNSFDGCYKTGLVGSSADQTCKNITFHHNYYKDVISRLPLARHANIHIYNNYYENCNTCLNIRSNAYVYSEYNFFDNCQKSHLVTNDETYTGTAIKSYNDIFISNPIIQSTRVVDREEYVDNLCKPDGTSNYSSFDINENQFYYDSINKKTDVSILNDTILVPSFTKKFAGINGKYNKLPLTKNIQENSDILNDLEEYDVPLSLDLSKFTETTTVTGPVVVGDFIIHSGINVYVSSTSKFLKTASDTSFDNKTEIIEFTTTEEDKHLKVTFASRNTSAYDRYLIILDENGNEIAKSDATEGATIFIYEIDLEPNKTYYIGSIKGLNIYSIECQ